MRESLTWKALNGFYSDLPTRCIKSTQRALLSQIADMLSIQPVGAPGFKMERWATDLAKSIQGLCQARPTHVPCYVIPEYNKVFISWCQKVKFWKLSVVPSLRYRWTKWMCPKLHSGVPLKVPNTEFLISFSAGKLWVKISQLVTHWRFQ